MPKRILYYIPRISQDQGGIFQYSTRVLDSLQSLDHQIIVYSITEQVHLRNRYENSRNTIVPHLKEPNLMARIKGKLKRISTLLNKELPAFPVFSDDTILDTLIREHDIDLVHSPTQAYPLTNTPFVFTLHDIQEIHMPQYFSPLERESRARNNRIGCQRAEKVIVSYEHVRQDLKEYFNVTQEKVGLVFIGTSDVSLSPRKDTLKNKSNRLLYPAATWPHKNHINLIKAFALAKREHSELDGLILTCTGAFTPHKEEIEKVVIQEKMDGQVEFKGLVSDLELKELYDTCSAVIIPTCYEAGSFPLMEAIVQHIPVVCSNVTSLPGAIDNDEFTFAPDDLSQMSECIHRITSDPQYRERNILNSIRVRPQLVDVDIASSLERVYAQID